MSYDKIYEYLSIQIQTNEFAIAGLLLAAISSLGYALLKIPKYLAASIRRFFSHSIVLEGGQLIYDEFNIFLNNKYSHKFRNTIPIIETQINEVTGGANTTIAHDQSFDSYFILYRGYPIFISKTIKELKGANNIYNARLGIYKITTLFKKDLLRSLCDELVEQRLLRENKNKTICTYMYDTHSREWDNFDNFSPIKLENIASTGNTKKLITDKIETWKKNSPRLKEMGIKNKLGIMLHGGAGNGKSSLAAAIAFKLNMYVYYLDINGMREASDLTRAMSQILPNSAIFIEEIDTLYDKDRNPINPDCKVPFSTFLNFMDGVIAKDNMLLIGTTNKIDQLDDALLRDGRFDLVVEVLPPDQKSTLDYLKIFYGSVVDENIEIGNVPKSFSKLANWCKYNIDDYEKVLDKLDVKNKK